MSTPEDVRDRIWRANDSAIPPDSAACVNPGDLAIRFCLYLEGIFGPPIDILTSTASGPTVSHFRGSSSHADRHADAGKVTLQHHVSSRLTTMEQTFCLYPTYLPRIEVK